jgi:citrate synthase
MGFGHRVYKNYDPRSKVMKQVAIDILNQSKTPNKTLQLALELEKAALADDYFIKRKLYPNVDFYTGIVYRAIGIPLDMFTVMFAVGRTSGWVCQWREMMLENQRKIGRPRQLYVGETKKEYVKIEDRRRTFLTSAESDEKDFPVFPKLPAFVKLPIL